VSPLNPSQREKFDHDGYLPLPGFLEGSPLIAKILEERDRLIAIFCHRTIRSIDSSIFQLSHHERGTLYRGLRYLPSVAKFASDDVLLSLSRALGLRFPAIMRSYNIRMDLPGDEQHAFWWHQDISYLLGSLNSVTFWIPLSTADAENGSVELIPGSHRLGLLPVESTSGQAPQRSTILGPTALKLKIEPTGSRTILNARPGDLVVFSQFLVHRTYHNTSNAIRWTVQVRHSDLSERRFVESGYPMGDLTNIFHTDYLNDSANMV